MGGTRRCALLLMGPTGAGKSDIALEIAARLPFDIVSVDSAQVFRGMDIGTAKPDRSTRERIPHHLIDIRDPATSYSAGEFLRDAGEAMGRIWAQGRQPLLVGGTMLYFHALHAGLADLPQADARIREEIDAQAAAGGWERLHRELARVDPAAAARIHVNDPQRIQRALEVYRATGTPITRLQHNGATVLQGVEAVEFAVTPSDRLDLHRRIATRFEAMMASGFIEEVRRLYERSDLTAEHPSMRAGRISSGMDVPSRAMQFERGERKRGCGDAATGQATVDVAQAASIGDVAEFHATSCGIDDYGCTFQVQVWWMVIRLAAPAPAMLKFGRYLPGARK